ncbi:plasmid mobilization protein [Microbispora rosea]|uniref:plasmid mobilization protein n=1 Tax=Microbispora rosea TaxID=58117 RepID=UPI00055A84C3|nr:ribbon-helix-helix protein, CopG family [Microbispora rosea]
MTEYTGPWPPEDVELAVDDESDVDLGTEELYDRRGNRIDEAYVEAAVEHVRRTVGRPSLTAPGRRSPQVTFRLSPEEKAAARALAEREGKTVSQLAREAFARYLRDHAA